MGTRLIGALIGFIAYAAPALASIIDPNSLTLVATVIYTRGQYDNAGLDTWNGSPLSSTNQPSYEQNQLSGTWNFYVDPSASNTFYIQATNVLDTDYSYIYGTPFDLTALTGFQFSLPVITPTDATFSDQYAVAGEALLGPVAGSSTPLDTTPGWSLTSVSGAQGDRTYQINASSLDYAFTHFSSVYGETRIFGGGIFQLVFDPSVDLLIDADFQTLQASASNGFGAYLEEGTLIFPQAVPEPSSGLLILPSLIAFTFLRRQAKMLRRALDVGQGAVLVSLPALAAPRRLSGG